MLGMRAISLTIRGPRGGRTLDLDHPFVAVHGPTNTGKTSLADAISYCLGQKVRWKKAFGEFVTECELHVRIAGSDYILRRALGRAGSEVEVKNVGHEPVALLPVKKDRNLSQPSFSDWLLTELHLKQVIDPDTIRALGAESTRLTFDDLWQYLYRTQAELDRQVILHSGGRSSARKALFELLFGLSSTEVRLLEAKRSEAGKAVREQKSTVESVHTFFSNSGTSPEQAEAELETARKEIERLTSDLVTLRAQVADWEEERTALRDDHTKARKAWLKAAAAAEQHRRGHIPGAAGHIGDALEECPACGQGIRSGRAGSGACDLCWQVTQQKTPASNPGGADTQHADAEYTRSTAALDQVHHALQEHEANEPQDARASIERLSNQKAACRERLDQLLPRVRTLRDLVASAETAKSEADQIEQDLKTVRGQIPDRETILDELEGYFHKEVSEIKPPWFDGSATLDRKSFLPLVDDQSFDQLGGGGKGAVNVAYSFALLAFSSRLLTDAGQEPLLPSFLVVDAIRKNIGANKEDNQLSERLYKRASILRDGVTAYGQGQIIVLDNDAPPKELVRSGVVRLVPLSYDDPLIPGVSHTDTGENPNA